MKQLALVFLGGGLGSVLRYGMNILGAKTGYNLAFSTFAVNVIGSLLIGIILGLVAKNSTISGNTALFLATGFCGGLTTFSTFAYENYDFLRSGELFPFALYVTGSLVVGIAAVFFGIWLARFI